MFKKKKEETIEDVIKDFNHYPNVKKAIAVFDSCTLHCQKLVALSYARLAIVKDVQPVGNKPEDIAEMHVERAGLERFFTSLVSPGGFEI